MISGMEKQYSIFVEMFVKEKTQIGYLRSRIYLKHAGHLHPTREVTVRAVAAGPAQHATVVLEAEVVPAPEAPACVRVNVVIVPVVVPAEVRLQPTVPVDEEIVVGVVVRRAVIVVNHRN